MCCHLERLINRHSVLIAPFQIKGFHSVSFNAELYHCTVLFNDDVTIR